MCSRIERLVRAALRTVREAVDGERAQSTVEASFALPIALVLVLLLVQPGIVLYDRIVMEAAAAEGCRLLATSSDSGAVEDFIRRRLSAVPEQDMFHIHGGGCTWRIDLEGGEGSSQSRVVIRNEVQPVPLIGAGMRALGLTNGNGTMEITVEASQPTQPDWAAEAGVSPQGWVSTWNG